MGRTLPTFNTYLVDEEKSWSTFKRSLRSSEEKEAFTHLFTRVRTYTAESTAAARPVPFDAILISLLLSQELELRKLERRLHRLEERNHDDS